MTLKVAPRERDFTRLQVTPIPSGADPLFTTNTFFSQDQQ
jgi:hypothetical protein